MHCPPHAARGGGLGLAAQCHVSNDRRCVGLKLGLTEQSWQRGTLDALEKDFPATPRGPAGPWPCMQGGTGANTSPAG